jgi:hypothetical protein
LSVPGASYSKKAKLAYKCAKQIGGNVGMLVNPERK